MAAKHSTNPARSHQTPRPTGKPAPVRQARPPAVATAAPAEPDQAPPHPSVRLRPPETIAAGAGRAGKLVLAEEGMRVLVFGPSEEGVIVASDAKGCAVRTDAGAFLSAVWDQVAILPAGGDQWVEASDARDLAPGGAQPDYSPLRYAEKLAQINREIITCTERTRRQLPAALPLVETAQALIAQAHRALTRAYEKLELGEWLPDEPLGAAAEPRPVAGVDPDQPAAGPALEVRAGMFANGCAGEDGDFHDGVIVSLCAHGAFLQRPANDQGEPGEIFGSSWDKLTLYAGVREPADLERATTSK